MPNSRSLSHCIGPMTLGGHNLAEPKRGLWERHLEHQNLNQTTGSSWPYQDRNLGQLYAWLLRASVSNLLGIVR